METYIVLLKHDEGKIKIQVGASSQDAAVDKVLKAERAPASAVITVTKIS
jgi:hypothetical protein